MIKFILLGIFLVFASQQAFGENVTMSTDQTDYYFLIGEDAAVATTLNSTFTNTLSGDIAYTTVVTVRQPNIQTTNTNVGNSPVQINPGIQQLLIQFGRYPSTTTLQTTLKITYSDMEEYTLEHDFTVHIVEDNSQKNNQNNPSQSSSQQNSQQQQGANQGRDEQNSQQGQQQNSQSRDPLSKEISSKLQNNQIPQDGEALRQKFQDDVKAAQEAEKQFKEDLLKNENFEKLSKELQEEGYDLKDSVFNTQSNDTGNFTLDYQNPQGQWASVQGAMEDGNLEELTKQTQVSQEAMNENLRSSESFQELDQQLLEDGFVETGTEFDAQNRIQQGGMAGQESESENQGEGAGNSEGSENQGEGAGNSEGSENQGEGAGNSEGSENQQSAENPDGTENPEESSENQGENAENTGEDSGKSDASETKDAQKTKVKVQYENPETNVTATITGDFEEEELKQVVLERSDSPFDFLWWIIPLWGIVGLIAYILYRKYRRDGASGLAGGVPFDYRMEARRLMAIAQEDHKRKEYKDAFANSGRAIRMLVSYQLGLNKEVTNRELLNHLDHTMKNFMQISQALGTCSLVEFAKAEPTDDNFENMVSVFEFLYGKNQIKRA